MGADLYREKGYNKVHDTSKPAFDAAVKVRDSLPAGATKGEKDEAQRKVDEAYGAMNDNPYYFRDSYNGSSLVWKFDLSWWQTEHINEDGEMTPSGAEALLAEMKSLEHVFEQNIAGASAENQKYFRDKYATFQDFLRGAIEDGENISCSV